jgi:NADPH-dependent curcumin reductase CurA
MPSEGDFELAQVLLPEPGEGEILMRNTNLFKGENFGKMLVTVGPDPAV